MMSFKLLVSAVAFILGHPVFRGSFSSGIYGARLRSFMSLCEFIVLMMIIAFDMIIPTRVTSVGLARRTMCIILHS